MSDEMIIDGLKDEREMETDGWRWLKDVREMEKDGCR
jgi:hypothetical protein